jgi:hypothetical protein
MSPEHPDQTARRGGGRGSSVIRCVECRSTDLQDEMAAILQQIVCKCLIEFDDHSCRDGICAMQPIPNCANSAVIHGNALLARLGRRVCQFQDQSVRVHGRAHRRDDRRT